MSNHSPDGEAPRAASQLGGPIGATGRFPQGKLTEDDEGEIRFGIGVDKNKVIFDFGSPVVWLGMPAEAAFEIAEQIKRAADLASEYDGG